MSIITVTFNTLSACNWHMSLYGAFGAALLCRAVLGVRNRRHESAREDASAGLVHVLLSMF